MPPLHTNPPRGGQILIAPPAPLQEALSSLCSLQRGVVVLAVPPMICAGCGKPRSLFVNRDGRTVCVSDCAAPGSIDG
jgi:hypothetical protein